VNGRELVAARRSLWLSRRPAPPRRSRLLSAAPWLLVCIGASACGGSRSPVHERPSGREAHLALPAGRTLVAWREDGRPAVFLEVPGFDAVDAIHGRTVVSYSASQRTKTRVDEGSQRLLHNYLVSTYGYTLHDIRAALARGRRAPQPAFVSRALDGTRRPSEVTVRHAFSTVASLSGYLHRPLPSPGAAVLGLPLAVATTVDDTTRQERSRGLALVYSSNRVDPARAPFFLTLSVYARGSEPGRGDLSLTRQRFFARRGTVGYRSRGDPTEVVATLGRWVVLIASSKPLTRSQWRTCVRRLRLS
jgi:hypothetical protein